MLIAATGIASAVVLTRGDVAYGLVIVWAFAGIGDLERRLSHNHLPETVLYPPYDQLPHGHFH